MSNSAIIRKISANRIGIGAKVVGHARYVAFQMAEVAIMNRNVWSGRKLAVARRPLDGKTPRRPPAICYVRSTSTPAVCGATMRRCRRAAGCRPMLLAIPPFKNERARAIGARMSAFGGCSTTSVEGASAQGDAV